MPVLGEQDLNARYLEYSEAFLDCYPRNLRLHEWLAVGQHINYANLSYLANALEKRKESLSAST